MKYVNLALFICFLINRAYSDEPLSGLTVGTCGKDPIISDFDPTRYAGKWYEFERVDFIFEANLKCVSAEYGLINDTFVSVRNIGVNKYEQKKYKDHKSKYRNKLNFLIFKK